MSLLDRVILVVNKLGAPYWWLESAGSDGRLKRAGKLARDGAQATGVIVGISRDSSDDLTTEVLAVQVLGGPRAGCEPLVAPIGRLRLGMPVLVRHDDEHAVLDWPAMCARWGLDPGSPAFRRRRPPEDGVHDKALDGRVQKRLKRWTPARAEILGLERKVVLGMPTDNWRMAVAVAGGGEASCDDHVPFYARWIAAPGVTVPVAVDPEDASRVVVDWPAAAVEWQARAGGLDDVPPPGSIAEHDEQRRTAEHAAMQAPPPPPPPPADLEPVEGVTLETWAAIQAGHSRDRVAPADYDAYAQRHGVPPGRWAAVDAAWRARMMSDWRVGAQIGAAIEAARKRR